MNILTQMSAKWGNMVGWDWAILVVAVIAIRLVSLSTRKYMKGVADFLSANRSAGRYLLTIASSMGGSGAISFVAAFQIYFSAGFTPIWWVFMAFTTSVIIPMTGWVYYRYRESRAMTMAQFYEMRYSKSFRVLAGVLIWASGIINFGIFPGVTAHFFIYFCGLPQHFMIPGIHLLIPTFPVVMALDLALALLFVTQGGQISVMITECVQGMFSAAAFVVIGTAILVKLSWPEVVQALHMAPQNASMMHPYHTGQIHDFNIYYYIIMIIGNFYGFMSWQGTQGFYCSARNPHEQKMGKILEIWRLLPQNLIWVLMPVAAFALLHLSRFAGEAQQVKTTLSTISNTAVRDYMITPVAMAHFLPIGVKGLFATCMLFFSFTCHDTYMHSWGSVFIQDVYMPIKKTVLSPEKHIQLLRYSIAFVAVFSFVFSMIYPLSDKIWMFFNITGTISGAAGGACIVGGFYWRKGTTKGAFTAVLVGGILGLAGVFGYPIYKRIFHHDFPVNGQWFSLIGMLAAIGVYWFVSSMHFRKISVISIVGSLLILVASLAGLNFFFNWLNSHHGSVLPFPLIFAVTGALTMAAYALVLLSRKRDDVPEFNLEKLLHRGAYAVANDRVTVHSKPNLAEKLLGITKEFSLGDKVLAVALIVWNAGWLLIFLGATAWHYTVAPLSDLWFQNFWKYYVWLLALTSIPATVVFQIGGIIDIKHLFKTLASAVRDDTDDGRVVHERDSDDLGLEESELSLLSAPGGLKADRVTEE